MFSSSQSKNKYRWSIVAPTQPPLIAGRRPCSQFPHNVYAKHDMQHTDAFPSGFSSTRLGTFFPNGVYSGVQKAYRIPFDADQKLYPLKLLVAQSILQLAPGVISTTEGGRYAICLKAAAPFTNICLVLSVTFRGQTNFISGFTTFPANAERTVEIALVQLKGLLAKFNGLE